MNIMLTSRKGINKGSFLYAIMQKYSSSLVIQVSSFVTAIFVAKFLGPEMLGYWAIFQIIVRYFPVTNLGCSISINKEMGVNLGAGNKPEVKRILDSARFAQTWFPLPVVLILFIVSRFFESPLNWLILLAGIVGYIQDHHNLAIRYMNARERHGSVARVNILKSLMSLAIILPLTYFWSLEGRGIGSFVLHTILLIITLLFAGIFSFSIKYEAGALKRLINIGIFMSMQGFLATCLLVTDKIMAGSILDIKSLGIYTFSMYLVVIVEGIKKSVQGVLYQRQHFIFGKDNRVSRDLLEVSKNSVYLISRLTAVIAAVLLIPFAIAIHLYFPEYNDSLSISFIVVYSQVLGAFNVLNTINKHRKLTVYLLIAVIGNIVLSFLMAKLLGLYGIAISTLIVFTAYYLYLSIANLRIFDLPGREIIRILWELLKYPLISFLFMQVYLYCFRKYVIAGDYNPYVVGLVTFAALSIGCIPVYRSVMAHIKYLNSIRLQNHSKK